VSEPRSGKRELAAEILSEAKDLWLDDASVNWAVD